MKGIDKDGITQFEVAKSRKPSEGRRNARLGKKASEETRAKLRVINSRPRGCYREIWEELNTLCVMTGFTYKRIRNYWLLYDELNTEYSFTAARDAIAFLKTDGPQHNQIYVLCNETGYTFKRVTDNLWVLYDPKINPDGKQSFRGTALGAIRFLKAMKEWLTQRGMLTYQKK